MYDTYESISNPHTTETFSTSYVTLTTFISQVKVIAQISQVKAIATLAALYVLIHPAPLLRETPSTCKHAGTTPFAHAVRCTSTLKVVGPVRKTCTTRKHGNPHGNSHTEQSRNSRTRNEGEMCSGRAETHRGEPTRVLKRN